ncbi:MAG: hypothetical protein WC452_01380 [Aminobacteriaceae bacterium]|nr:hypothetical protein [Synergistaceae bacterium]
MKQASRIFLLLSLLFSLLCGLPALEAAETGEASGWTFSTTPYVWFSGLNGTVGVKGYKARVNLSFSDVLSDMDASGMLTFQGHKGNQYFFFDGMYLDLSDTEQLSASLFTDIGVTMTRLQAAWGVRVKEWESSSLHVFAGLRYWNLKNELTIRTASAPLRHFSDSESWLDPLIGIRFATRLSPNLTFLAVVDAGGFGVGSDFTWGGMVDLSWRLSERTSLEVGYRYLYVDYEKDGFVMDAYNDGIFIGLTWKVR